ncbi:MAG: STAS domain-containing protein [Acidobacteria bacterium]|nr:STAS domain-containing protein [Acidobacteriota bacterium]
MATATTTQPDLPLQIEERLLGAVTLLELEGRLVFGPEADALAAYIQALLRAGRTRLLLRLDKLTRLDSVGVGTLIDAGMRARRAGGRLCLVRPSKPARDVLNFLGFTGHFDLLEIFPDEQAALDSLAPGAGLLLAQGETALASVQPA